MNVRRQQNFEVRHNLRVEQDHRLGSWGDPCGDPMGAEGIFDVVRLLQAVLAREDAALVGLDDSLIKPDRSEPFNPASVEDFRSDDTLVAWVEHAIRRFKPFPGEPDALDVVEA